MAGLLRAACLQMCSGNSVADNLATVAENLQLAPALDVLVLPENFAQIPASRRQQHVELMNDGVVQKRLSELAQDHKVMIVGGSIAIRDVPHEKPFARSLVFDRNGRNIGHYDKIHLFDVDVGEDTNKQRYRESDTFQHGGVNDLQSRPICGDFSAGSVQLGLSICYDLRFPELYQMLSRSGAQVICVAAAFTSATGRAHWQTLLTARAIENQVFIVAAAQFGKHANDRCTWGHSMIIDPWGTVVAEQSDGEGLVFAELDLSQVLQLNENFPVQRHRRL